MATSKKHQDVALANAVVDAAAQDPDRIRSAIYKAIAVQRPAVLSYLKSVRRSKPDATPAEILTELEKRYVATVTTASSGVGASAAIPAVGIPLAIGLGVADLLFFYETSALFVLAAAELRGIEVADAERAQPLVFGMLLGEKSQSKISQLVLQASGVGGIDVARKAASGVAKNTWAEVLTQQLPDSALAPLGTVLAREALMASAKAGSRAVGKVLPFGIGAVIGGVGSFTFGRDVVRAARAGLPDVPDAFPASLADFAKPDAADSPNVEPSRAVVAMRQAADNVGQFSGTAWSRVVGAAQAAPGVARRGVDAVAGTVAGALQRGKRSGGTDAEQE